MLLRLGVPRRWAYGVEPALSSMVERIAWADLSQRMVFTEYRHQLEQIDARITRFERDRGRSQLRFVCVFIAALQALRGVKLLTAATIVAEVGDLTRFASPTQFMSYAGFVPSEHSSGGRTRRGSITKSGNAHLRRILIESAWHYRHQPSLFS